MNDNTNFSVINGGKENLSEVDVRISETLRQEKLAFKNFKEELDWENLKWDSQMKQIAESAFSVAFGRGFRAGEKEESDRLIEIYKIDSFRFDVELAVHEKRKKSQNPMIHLIK